MVGAVVVDTLKSAVRALVRNVGVRCSSHLSGTILFKALG